MSTAGFSYQDLLQIVDLIKTSEQFDEFHLKVGDIELDIRRGAPAPATGAAAANTSVRQISAYASIAPLDIPVTKIRRGSIGICRETVATTCSTKPTSSTPFLAGGPQQSPAFHARPEPSG